MKQAVTLIFAAFVAACFSLPVASGFQSFNTSEPWRFAQIFPEYTTKIQNGLCPYLPEPVDLPDPIPDILQDYATLNWHNLSSLHFSKPAKRAQFGA